MAEEESNNKVAGRGAAITSLILGIIAIVLSFFGLVASEWWVLTFPIIALVVGIVGMVLAASARRRGYKGGIRIVGLIFSLIGIICGIVFIILCALIAGEVIALS